MTENVFDLGSKDDVMFTCNKPTGVPELIVIGWFRIDYGHLYTDSHDVFSYKELLATKAEILKAHEETYEMLSARTPEKFGDMIRENWFNNATSDYKSKNIDELIETILKDNEFRVKIKLPVIGQLA